MPTSTAVGFIQECQDQLTAMLEAVDYSAAWEPGDANPDKTVILVPGWHPDRISDLEILAKGQMTNPIITVISLPHEERSRTFNDMFKPGRATAPGTKDVHGVQVVANHLVVCWADDQTGAGEMTRRLAGIVHGAVLANRNAMSSYKHLSCRNAHESYDDKSQLWHVDLIVSGDTVVNYDA